MEPKELLSILHTVEKLKDTTRHSYTSGSRHESVAEHSWRMTLMAFLLKDNFKHLDMDKVIEMCLIHDLGEIFTGDIPAFDKTKQDSDTEDELLYKWVDTLPNKDKMNALYKEMKEKRTEEAKLYKALDRLEAVIQHNESDISTWTELEYSLNLVYGKNDVEFSDYLKEFRELIKQETLTKIENPKR